jgi:hypothetical protein
MNRNWHKYYLGNRQWNNFTICTSTKKFHLISAKNAHTHTHTQYIIRISFPLQQWFHEHDSLLRYTYTAWPVLWKMSILSSYLLSRHRKLVYRQGFPLKFRAYFLFPPSPNFVILHLTILKHYVVAVKCEAPKSVTLSVVLLCTISYSFWCPNVLHNTLL